MSNSHHRKPPGLPVRITVDDLCNLRTIIDDILYRESLRKERHVPSRPVNEELPSPPVRERGLLEIVLGDSGTGKENPHGRKKFQNLDPKPE